MSILHFSVKVNDKNKGGEILRKSNLSPFGKEIKKRLLDIDQSQNWLIDKVKEKTGLYFDSSYMNKILTGTAKTPSITRAICEILEIEVTE